MIDYQFLLIQNQWWLGKEEINKDLKIKEFQEAMVHYTPREILDLDLAEGAIHIVTGPRQTGKSTALKLLIKNLLEKGIPSKTIFYFNCDALSNKQDVVNLIMYFLNVIKTTEGETPVHYLLLDEISSIPDWPFGIKWLADAGLLSQSKIILTGSSSISLRKSGEFLPGRRNGGKDIQFLPISFIDYFRLLQPDVPVSSLRTVSDLIKFSRLLLEKHIDAQALYRKFLLSGGFLKVIDAMMKNQSFADVIALYKTTLQSELAKFGRKEANMREVVRKLIRSITSETSYTNIAEEAELGSKNTAVEYLNFLTESFFLLELFFYNISERRLIFKKNKKYYPSDPFLFWIFHAFIAGTEDVEGIYKTYLSWPKDAQLAEAFVASELHKKKFAFSFSSGTKELDFYIPNLELGVEVKYKEKITKDDLESLTAAKRKILVSKDTLEDRNGVMIVPAYLFGFLEISA